MLNFEDFEKDGRVDWTAFNAARKQAGECCSRCESPLIAPLFVPKPEPAPRLCYSCRDLDEDLGEVDSDDFIRCPHCREQSRVHDGENYSMFEDGEHEVSCDSCGKDFTVSTSVSYSFSSPAIVKAKP